MARKKTKQLVEYNIPVSSNSDCSMAKNGDKMVFNLIAYIVIIGQI